MLTKLITVSLITGLTTLASPAFAQAQQGTRVNVSGSYRCEPQPSPCQWPGRTLWITPDRHHPRSQERAGLDRPG